MKIGILTLPLHINYGGLLQNYALQYVLKGMGHDVETIDHSASSFHKALSLYKADLLHYLFKKKFKKPNYNPSYKEYAIIRRNTDNFIKKYISCSKTLHSVGEFKDIVKSERFEAYIVGSDQCWRPRYNGSYLYEMFLRFAKDQNKVKRIAYAASFGTSIWEYTHEQTKTCSFLVKKFDLVTVREKSGVALCRKHFGIEASLVLDPTMLLDKEEYERLVENEKEPKSNGYLFYYILDPSEQKKSVIENIAVKQGIKPFTVMPKCQAEKRTKDDVRNRIEECVYPSVTSWLRAFMDAKMVVVDSFHGAVFSIIFNKPFWVIGNNERGNARFESLLGMFGLVDRMITLDAFSQIDIEKEIDWTKVNHIREIERKKSMSLLKESLQ